MKRALILLISITCIITTLSAKDLHLKADVLVNQVRLSWDKVDDATWYDIYDGEAFITRLPSEQTSYTVEHLSQDAVHRIVLGARDGANATLDAEAVSVTTASYEGTYVWTNPTDDDNKGRMKELVYHARLVEDREYGQYMEISIDVDGRRLVIFPLQGFDEGWPWVDTDSGSDVATAYLANCAKMNSLNITPSRFRTGSVRISTDSAFSEVVSHAMGLDISTTTSFTFGADEEGAWLDLSVDGPGVVRMALFDNPLSPDAPHTFRLRRI